MIKTKVGKRIKELRNKLGISQEELAFRSEIHRTYIASLEVGKRNVSIETLEKFRAFLYLNNIDNVHTCMCWS